MFLVRARVLGRRVRSRRERGTLTHPRHPHRRRPPRRTRRRPQRPATRAKRGSGVSSVHLVQAPLWTGVKTLKRKKWPLALRKRRRSGTRCARRRSPRRWARAPWYRPCLLRACAVLAAVERVGERANLAAASSRGPKSRPVPQDGAARASVFSLVALALGADSSLSFTPTRASLAPADARRRAPRHPYRPPRFCRTVRGGHGSPGQKLRGALGL